MAEHITIYSHVSWLCANVVVSNEGCFQLIFPLSASSFLKVGLPLQDDSGKIVGSYGVSVPFLISLLGGGNDDFQWACFFSDGASNH